VPQVVPGMLLIGDAAGAVNPFNGEGIAYAMETAEVAADLVHEALVKDRPGIAMMYPTVLRERYGDYFRIGRGFAKLIGRPAIMSRATRHMLPNARVMGFAMRVMANLTDGPDGDRQDRLFHLLQRIARAA
jgi:flavin-dependent dehydrogenase